jgi:hypothetical protein
MAEDPNKVQLTPRLIPHSSLSESLTQGIPLIVWPASGEQALNAAFFSTGPNPVAIELFQVSFFTCYI